MFLISVFIYVIGRSFLNTYIHWKRNKENNETFNKKTFFEQLKHDWKDMDTEDKIMFKEFYRRTFVLFIGGIVGTILIILKLFSITEYIQ